MDGAKLKVIEKVTEKETDWTDRISMNVDMGSINEKKQIIIDIYEKLLDFLKDIQFKNEEDLIHIKKPLDDLESYLNYIPNGPLFNDVLPTEMKLNILNYLCDSNTFIASCVCQEWEKILYSRFKEQEVIIGGDRSKCEDSECVNPENILTAAADHKIDVHLVICKPVTQIHRQLVTDALTSVSKFTITPQLHHLSGGAVTHVDYGNGQVPILSEDQFEHFFESIEEGDKIMKEVKLVDLDLNGLNQERLANFLVNNIERLTLDYVELNVLTFMTKLQHDSANLKVTHLTLCDFDLFEYPDDVANALCKVENVKLLSYAFPPFTRQVMERLVENILQTRIMMKTLIISIVNIPYLNQDICPDFGSLINPRDLKTMFKNLSTVQLEGLFTLEQLESVRSLPDGEVVRVQIENSEDFFHSAKKGSSEMF